MRERKVMSEVLSYGKLSEKDREKIIEIHILGSTLDLLNLTNHGDGIVPADEVSGVLEDLPENYMASIVAVLDN